MSRTYGETLWIELVTEKLNSFIIRDDDGFAAWIPGPYSYLGFLIFFDAVVLSLIQYMRFGTAVIVDNPTWIFIAITVVLGLFANRYMRDQYAKSIKEIRVDRRTEGHHGSFFRLVPKNFKRNVFILFLTVYYTYILVSGRLLTIITYEGGAGLIGWLLIAPIGYGLVLIETVAMYFSLHFFLPRRFDKYDVKIDFFDMQNLGGLRPIGELLKHSYYLFNSVVILFTGLMYAPFLLSRYLYTPYSPPDFVVTGLVFTLWGIGVLSIGHSFWKMHRYMRNARRKLLRKFDKHLDGIISNRYEVDQIDSNDDEMYRWFERRQNVIEQVQRTKEFPANRLMGIQLILSAVLPLLIEMLLRSLVSFT